MTQRSLAWLLCALLGGTAAVGCSGDAAKQAGETCVASSECGAGLVCDFGQSPAVCAGSVTVDAAPPIDAPEADAPPVDAAEIDGRVIDAPLPIDARVIDAPLPIDAAVIDAPVIDAPLPIDARIIDAPPPPIDAPPPPPIDASPDA